MRITGALKLANYQGAAALAERISALLEARLAAEAAQQGCCDDGGDDGEEGEAEADAVFGGARSHGGDDMRSQLDQASQGEDSGRGGDDAPRRTAAETSSAVCSGAAAMGMARKRPPPGVPPPSSGGAQGGSRPLAIAADGHHPAPPRSVGAAANPFARRRIAK